MQDRPDHQFPDVSRIAARTAQFLLIPAVVGSETPFLRKLEHDFGQLGLSAQRGARFLVVDGGDHAAPTLSVHIDRHGLVVAGEGELEYAAWRERAEHGDDDHAPGVALLEKICGRFVGETVFGYDAETGEHLAQGRISLAYVCGRRSNLVFHVDGLADLAEGTPVSYATGCFVERTSVSGQLDNALSAALVYELFREGFRGRVVFTAEEEIGRSWRHFLDAMADERPRTDLLVLDTSPFGDDQPDLPQVVLRRRDTHGAFDTEVIAALERACVDRGHRYLFKDEWLAERSTEVPARLGSTELGHLVAHTDGAWNGATLQVPTVGYHTNRESAQRDAIQATLEVLRAYALPART